MSLLKFSSVSYMKTWWELEIFLKIQYHRPPSYSLSANLILLVRVIFWETKKTIGYLTFWHEVKNLYLIVVKMLLLRMCLLFPWTNICWINQFFFFTAKYFCSAAFHIISAECLWHPSWDAWVITYTWSHDGYSSPSITYQIFEKSLCILFGILHCNFSQLIRSLNPPSPWTSDI